MGHEADLLFLRLCLVSVGCAQRDRWFIPGQTQILIVKPQAMNGSLQKAEKRKGVSERERARERKRQSFPVTHCYCMSV